MLNFKDIPFARVIPYLRVQFTERPMMSLEHKEDEVFKLYQIDGKEGVWVPATWRVHTGEYEEYVILSSILWAKINEQNAGQFVMCKEDKVPSFKVDDKKEKLWALFHKQWTRDVGSNGYNKNDWKELETLILHFLNDKSSKELQKVS